MAYQDPNQLNLPFEIHSKGENVQNASNHIQEMLDGEFAQKYPDGYKRIPLFGKAPYVEPTPPSGWLTKAQAVEQSGIDETLFESLLEDTDPNRGRQGSWSSVFISVDWVELSGMDPGFASQQMFMRFTAEAYGELKLLRIRHADLFKLNQYIPSKKQLAALWKLLDNPLLTPAERWLIELCKTDGRITKSEIGLLFKHFLGESDWIGGRWVKCTNGVLHKRKNAK